MQRKLKTLAITRKIPTGILIQQDEGFRAIETLDQKLWSTSQPVKLSIKPLLVSVAQVFAPWFR
jgi:hypothetical protein